MSAIVLAIVSALSGLPGVLGDYFKRKQEIQIIRTQTMRDIAVEKQKLAGRIAEAEAERAVMALKSTSQWFKQLVFFLLSTPFIAALIGFPEYSAMVFDNLRALPEWYLIMYTGIIGVIYGIPVPGSIMGNIWEGLKQSSANRREYKLERERIRSKKPLFDLIRRIKEKPLTQQDVDLVNEEYGNS